MYISKIKYYILLSIILFGTICLIIFSNIIKAQPNNMQKVLPLKSTYYYKISNTKIHSSVPEKIDYLNRQLLFDNYKIWDTRFKPKIASQPVEFIEEEIIVSRHSQVAWQIYDYDVNLSTELQNHIRNLCIEYNIDMSYIIAIIDRESSFNNNCIHYNYGKSPDGKPTSIDVGYMQINSSCHEYYLKKLGLTNIYDPYQNISIGVYIFYEHLQKFNYSYKLACIAYNTGWSPEIIKNKGITTTGYADSVIKLYEKYNLQINKIADNLIGG